MILDEKGDSYNVREHAILLTVIGVFSPTRH